MAGVAHPQWMAGAWLAVGQTLDLRTRYEAARDKMARSSSFLEMTRK
jgi:hypothetical protein